jgi:CRP-like cAMP-binding protein
MIDRADIKNRLLVNLSLQDFALLAPFLTSVVLPVKRVLQTRGKPIEDIYFLESGLASVVINTDTEHKIEIGVVGREGATGLSLILGASKSPYDTFMQSGGAGWQLSSAALRQAMGASRSLQDILSLFGHTQCVQMASTILANGRYALSERLARWLLMAHDRADGDTVFLTHEFLSVMLGVRRAGVTVALNSLELAGTISSKRGSIKIEHRGALKAAANGSYGLAEDEFETHFPSVRPGDLPLVPAEVPVLTNA